MMKVLPLVGFSAVVCPVSVPSWTDQKSGLPSQPSSVLPSKIGSNPSSLASSAARTTAAQANSSERIDQQDFMERAPKEALDESDETGSGVDLPLNLRQLA